MAELTTSVKIEVDVSIQAVAWAVGLIMDINPDTMTITEYGAGDIVNDALHITSITVDLCWKDAATSLVVETDVVRWDDRVWDIADPNSLDVAARAILDHLEQFYGHTNTHSQNSIPAGCIFAGTGARRMLPELGEVEAIETGQAGSRSDLREVWIRRNGGAPQDQETIKTRSGSGLGQPPDSMP